MAMRLQMPRWDGELLGSWWVFMILIQSVYFRNALNIFIYS